MKVGTKSLLFGVHQVIIHPFFVFITWWKLFGFPKDPRLWVAFIVHDWGYWGKSNMDGKGEGETHPEKGARIMHCLFDRRAYIDTLGLDGQGKLINSRLYDLNKSRKWYKFTLYHSRFYAKNDNAPISKLCIADKFVFCIQPKWMYIPMASWSGEIYEYMDEKKGRSGIAHKSKEDWYNHVKDYMDKWVKDEMNNIINNEIKPFVNKYIDVSNGTLKS